MTRYTSLTVTAFWTKNHRAIISDKLRTGYLGRITLSAKYPRDRNRIVTNFKFFKSRRSDSTLSPYEMHVVRKGMKRPIKIRSARSFASLRKWVLEEIDSSFSRSIRETAAEPR